MFFCKLQKRLERKQKFADSLNEKYKDELYSYCMIDGYIFIPIKFIVEEGRVVLTLRDVDTPEGYITYKDHDMWELRYETSLKKARANFLMLKKQLDQFGLQITIKDK